MNEVVGLREGVLELFSMDWQVCKSTIWSFYKYNWAPAPPRPWPKRHVGSRQVWRQLHPLMFSAFLSVSDNTYYSWFCLLVLDCAGRLLLCRLSLVVSSSYSELQCEGFSCCRAQTPGKWASVVAPRGLSSRGSQALEHTLHSCGASVQLRRGMRDLPESGIEPITPALAGGLLITKPPGKPQHLFFIKLYIYLFLCNMVLGMV